MNLISLSDQLKSEISQLNAHFQNVRENQVLEKGEQLEGTVDTFVSIAGFKDNADAIINVANVLDQGFNIESLNLHESIELASSKMVLEKTLEECGYPVQYEPEPETKWQ